MRDFTVVSTDVNAESLSAMHQGIYHEGKLFSLPKHLIPKYFVMHDETRYKIRPEIRRFLRIKRLNLHNSIDFERKFDYVFCRNVMIYFDEEGREKVLRNLLKNLRVGGVLFVGHSETLLDIPPQLEKEAQSLFRRKS